MGLVAFSPTISPSIQPTIAAGIDEQIDAIIQTPIYLPLVGVETVSAMLFSIVVNAVGEEAVANAPMFLSVESCFCTDYIWRIRSLTANSNLPISSSGRRQQ